MLAQSCDTDEFTAATTGIEQKIARYVAFLREAAFAGPGANLQAGADCGVGGVDSAETQWTQFGVRYGGSDDGVSSFLVVGDPVLGWCQLMIDRLCETERLRSGQWNAALDTHPVLDAIIY